MRQRSVLLLISPAYPPRLQGIARFARTHGWHLMIEDRLARLPRAERRGAWEHWRETLGSDCVHSLPRFDRVRRALRRLSFSMSFSLAAARLLRKGGVS